MVNGATTSYLLDLNSSLTQVLGEFGPGDDTYYLLGLDVIGQQTSAGWSYFGYDGLGSVRQMTDLTGALTYAASFDPYGSPFEQYAAASATLGFTGEQTDLNGLLYLRARYYNPALGTFLSRDPVQGVMGSALSFNPYLYVQGNPTNYVDPTGQFAWLALLIPFAKIVGAMIAGAAIGYASSRVVDAGAQLLFTGQIDWGQNAAAGVEGGILGAITGPFGLAAGALSARAVAQGVSRTLVRRAAFAFSLGLDVGVSAAWDTRVRGDGLGASLLSNFAGSVGGEIGGYLLGRASRAIGRAWPSVQNFSHNVGLASASLWLGTLPGGNWVHGNRRDGPGIVYQIARTNTQTGETAVYKYGNGLKTNFDTRAGETFEVPYTYNLNGRMRGSEYLNGPVTSIHPGENWMYHRPESQVRTFNRKRSEGGLYTYDWTLLAITENMRDADLLERYYTSRHVQIFGDYPIDMRGPNDRPRIFFEYGRYLLDHSHPEYIAWATTPTLDNLKRDWYWQP